jgi:hypothetical protein
MKPYRQARPKKAIARRLIAQTVLVLLVIAALAASPTSYYASDPAPAVMVP